MKMHNTQDWAMNPIRKAHGLSYKKAILKEKEKKQWQQQLRKKQ